MKKSFLVLFGAVMLAMTALTSCSKESEKIVAPVKSETQFSDLSGLKLTVNGREMTGCSVNYIPDANAGDKASMIVTGEIVQIPELLSSLISGIDLGGTKAVRTSTTSNVLPGAPALNLDVTLDVSGDAGSFQGEGATDYCTFSYKGTVSSSKLVLNLSNVSMKNKALQNTIWRPAAAGKNWGNTIGISSDSQLGSLIEMLLQLIPVDIPEGQGNLEQALCAVLRSLEFYDNGEWTVSYLESWKTMSYTNVPRGCLNYVVTGDNEMRVFLSVGDILRLSEQIKAAKGTKAGEDNVLTQLVEVVSGLVANALTDGIKINFEQNGDNLRLTFDSDLIMEIVTLLSTALSDQTIQAMLLGALGDDPMVAMLLPGLLQSLPGMVASTSTLNLSVNFTAPSIAN